jgi:hypothetical protein
MNKGYKKCQPSYCTRLNENEVYISQVSMTFFFLSQDEYSVQLRLSRLPARLLRAREKKAKTSPILNFLTTMTTLHEGNSYITSIHVSKFFPFYGKTSDTSYYFNLYTIHICIITPRNFNPKTKTFVEYLNQNPSTVS